MFEVEFGEKLMKSKGLKTQKTHSIAFKTPVQVTPVFESTSANILEISEKSYNATGLDLHPTGLLVEMPKEAVIPALVRMEFKLGKSDVISVYAKWTRQGHLFDFSFLIITPEDQARINAFLDI